MELNIVFTEYMAKGEEIHVNDEENGTENGALGNTRREGRWLGFESF